MTRARKLLRVTAVLGALLVAILVGAVVVSQTAWFRDWLRRYAMREAAQVVNGQLVIGRVDGGLWSGVQLHDVRVDQAGATVVALTTLSLEYRLLDVLREGMVVRRVDLVAPIVNLRRVGDTWNVATLLVEPVEPAEPDAPLAQFRIDHIELVGGTVTVVDPECPAGTPGCLPARIEHLAARARVESSAEGLALQLDDLSLVTVEPDLVLQRLAVDLRSTDTAIDVRGVELATTGTALTARARVDDYTTAPHVSARIGAEPLALEEIARFLPQMDGVRLAPVITLDVDGPLDSLRVVLDLTSEAGDVQTTVVADASAPVYGLAGTLAVERLDLSQVLMDPDLRTDLTATVDVDVAGAEVPTLAGNITVRAEGLQALAYEVDALDVRARMSDGVADIDGLLRAYGASVSTQGRVTYAEAEAGRVTYDVAGRVRSVNLRRLPATLGVPPLATAIGLDYRASGDLERVRATVDMRRSTVGDAVLGAGTRAAVALHDGRLAYSASGSIAGLDLQQMGRALDVDALDDDLYRSDLHATFDVEGRGTDLDTMVARARLDLATSSVGDLRIPDLQLDARVDRKALEAALAGRLENVRPEVYTGRDAIGGVLAGRFDISAAIPDVTGDIDLARLSADARVELDPAELAGVRLDGVRVDARLTNGAGEVREVLLASPAADVRMQGPVSLVADHETRLQYEIDVKDAGALASLADIAGLAGTARTEGVVSGWLEQLAVDGQLSAEGVIYSETGSMTAVRAAYAVTLPDLDTGRVAAEVRGTATGIDAGGTVIDTVAFAADYEADRATFDTDVTQDELSLGVGGVLHLEDAAQEVVLNRLDVRGAELSWALAPEAHPGITHRDGTVSVADLRLQSGAQRLAIGGSIELPGDETPLRMQDVTIEASAVDLAPLGRQFAADEVEGRLDASVQASGALTDGRATVTLAVRDAEVRGYAFAGLDATAAYDGGVADVDVMLQQDAQASLRASGRVPVAVLAGMDAPDGSAPDDRIDVTIASTPLDLAVVAALTSAIDEVRGRIQLDARVTGTVAQPLVDGLFTVQNGGFRVALTDATYEALQADVRFASDLVTVERLRLQDSADNPFEVTGTIAVNDGALGALDLAATTSGFQLLDGPLGDLGITADLALTGTAEAPVVRGSIAVPAGRVDVDRLLAAMADTDQEELRDDVDLVYEPPVRPLAALDVPGAPGPGPISLAAGTPAAEDEDAMVGEPQEEAADEPALPAALDQATVDVQLTVPNDLLLRADDLRAEPGGPSLGSMNLTVGADLRARQDPGEPLVMTGAITFVRGHYDFQGRRFVVSRDSAIRFQGPDATNPSLNLTAVRHVSGVEARVHVVGTAQEPELRLSSVPELDEADILAMIVFDRPLDDLGQGEQVSISRRAGELLGGRLTGALATSLRDALDVDLLEIDAFGPGGPSVTVGSRVGDRVFVRFRQQVGAQDASQILLEYELLRALRLQTSVTQGAQTDRSPGQRVERSGVDLLFFFSY